MFFVGHLRKKQPFIIFHVTRAPKLRTPAGILPYMGYIGMCGPKGYGFQLFWSSNRVSILADFGHKLGMFFVL